VRYLGAEMGRRYAETTAAVDNVLVALTPQRWRTTDYAMVAPPDAPTPDTGASRIRAAGADFGGRTAVGRTALNAPTGD
jgi:hypothetical protein